MFESFTVYIYISYIKDPIQWVYIRHYRTITFRPVFVNFQGIGKKALLSLLGFNPKAMPQIDLKHPLLPAFYCASDEPGSMVGEVSQVQRNCELAMDLLGSRGTRNVCICFDDSVYWPSYGLVYFPEPVVVGGCGKLSWVPLPEDSENPDEFMGGLHRDKLAQTCVSWILTRADSNSKAIDVKMRPRRLRDMKSVDALHESGVMWRQATQANDGVPPLAQSCDNHQTQAIFNFLFTGLLENTMGKLPLRGMFTVSFCINAVLKGRGQIFSYILI